MTTTLGAFLAENARAIFAAASPFILWLIGVIFQPKAKLIQQTRHRYTYLIHQPLLDSAGKVVAPNQVVNTASISVFNAGRSAATNVEIVFNWKPQNLNIWPSRHFTESQSPDGRYHLFFDALPSKDILGFEVLNINQDLPGVITVRSEQAVAAAMQTLTPQPIVPRWKQLIAIWLMIVGFAVSVYIMLLGLQFILLR